MALVAACSLLAIPALGATAAPTVTPVSLVNYTPALCMGPSLSPIDVYVDLAPGTARVTAVALERRYRPRSGATLTLDAKHYRLSLGGAGKVYTDRIYWSFRPIRVSAAQGERALGKALTLRYESTAGTKIVDGTLRPAGCVA